jgi:hypothetical protein
MLKITAILLGVMLLAVSLTTVIDVSEPAYAKKATQQKFVRNHHAHYIGNKVCGDELCSGQAYVKRVK